MTTGFIYVNIDLRHQYGISVAESQTFLLAKRPSAAMSEENVCRSQATINSYHGFLRVGLEKILSPFLEHLEEHVGV